MPGGRPKDSYRVVLASRAGIPYEKTRKISIFDLENLARLGESERKLIISKPAHEGRAPRYNTRGMTTTSIREFTSRQMAENVAIVLERMTGESCTISRSTFGDYTVIRHCTGEKMEVV